MQENLQLKNEILVPIAKTLIITRNKGQVRNHQTDNRKLEVGYGDKKINTTETRGKCS